MNDGRKNVPFALDGADSDVFSSVEVNRGPDDSAGVSGGEVYGAQATQKMRQSGALPAAPVVRPRLAVETFGGSGHKTCDITSESFSIGRRNVDLELADQYACGYHAQIAMRDGTAFLRPVALRNGVFLRIADDLALEDWDEIAIGSQRFVFRTTWDRPEEPHNPNLPYTPTIGGNLPPDAARLIQMYAGGQIGSVWRVKTSVTIGRANSQICEPDDPWLSTPHAMIERRSDGFYIKDANSQHGTFIRVVEGVELIDGDEFMIGRTRIKITYP